MDGSRSSVLSLMHIFIFIYFTRKSPAITMLKAKFLYQLVGMLVNFIVCFVLQESLPSKNEDATSKNYCVTPLENHRGLLQAVCWIGRY